MNNSNDIEVLHADFAEMHAKQQAKVMDHMLNQIFSYPKEEARIKRQIQAKITFDPRLTNILKAGELNPNIIKP